MISTKTSRYVTTGNVGGEKIAMSIAVYAMQHIMDAMTDLYSDPIKAVVRELSTNARDATIEAGSDAPIRVTTPTALSPFFVVQDSGIGMDADDIRDIYSQYGASTKRETNEQTGMLGFGCKSPLSYTNQFTVVGVKDGRRIAVLVAREATGGSMTIVDNSATTEPNGVTIQVPVRPADADAFEEAAEDFFSVWPADTVLLNGKVPKRLTGLPITDDITLVESYEGSRVVMGGVSYPCRKLSTGLGYSTAIVAHVPIGAVDFTPAREELHYTALTEATLAQIQAEFDSGLPGAIQREMDACATKPEAVDLFVEWKGKLSYNRRVDVTGITYKGEAIPDRLSFGSGWLTVPRSYHRLSDHYTDKALPITQDIKRLVVVTGYDREKFTAGQRKKLDFWAVSEGHGSCNYVLTRDDDWSSEWVTPVAKVDWATIKALKLPKSTTGSSQPTHRVSVPGTYKTMTIEDIAEFDGEVFYDIGKWSASMVDTILKRWHGDDWLVVCCPRNRLEKLKREVPAITHVSEEVSRLHKAWVAALTDDEKNAMAMQDALSTFRGLRYLDESRVDDPEVKSAIRAVNVDLSHLRTIRKEFSDQGLYTEDAGTIDVVNPLEPYKLLTPGYSQDQDHLYFYMNALYAQKGA